MKNFIINNKKSRNLSSLFKFFTFMSFVVYPAQKGGIDIYGIDAHQSDDYSKKEIRFLSQIAAEK